MYSQTVIQPLTPDTAKEGTSAWDWGAGNAGDRIGIKGSADLATVYPPVSSSSVVRMMTMSSTVATRMRGLKRLGKIDLRSARQPYRNVANWYQANWLGGRESNSLGGRGHVGDGGSRLNGIRYDGGGSGPFSISVMGTTSFDSEVQDSRQTRVRYVNNDDVDNTDRFSANRQYILLNHPKWKA